ncbi:MAG TPA: sigma-70 family RNA polymerase sigma factor [Planctomycetes bacterium]|nr:sigma-70 family RNA polymerase sigma factor [Planctomycetota bacterium]
MGEASRTAAATESDEELVARALVERGTSHTEAFEELVDRHQGALFHFLILRVGNRAEAEELTQDAFLRAFEGLDRFRPRWRFRTWLFTIAKRLAVSRARRARSEALAPEGLLDPDEMLDPAASSARREEVSNLWDLAARVLSREKRSALWLCYGEGLDAGEIAHILGRPRVSVRVLLFRARQELARAFGAAERSPEHAADPSTPALTSPVAPTPSGGMK